MKPRAGKATGLLSPVIPDTGEGRMVTYEYDTGGRLTTVRSSRSGVTRFTYDGSHNMRTIEEPTGRVIVNDYDGKVYRYGDGSGDPLAIRLTDKGAAYHIAKDPKTGNCYLVRFDDVVYPDPANFEKEKSRIEHDLLAGSRESGVGKEAKHFKAWRDEVMRKALGRASKKSTES